MVFWGGSALFVAFYFVWLCFVCLCVEGFELCSWHFCFFGLRVFEVLFRCYMFPVHFKKTFE